MTSKDTQNLFHQTQTNVSTIQKITSNPGAPSNESLRKPPKTPGELNTGELGTKKVIDMPAGYIS